MILKIGIDSVRSQFYLSAIKISAIIIGIVCFAFTLNCYAAETKNIIKTQKGLKFTVPEDWPIEERGGVVAPVPVEEYVTTRLKSIESRLDTLAASLESLKTSVSGMRSNTRNKSKETAPASEEVTSEAVSAGSGGEVKTNVKPIAADMKDLRYETEEIKSKVNLLDKKNSDDLKSIELRLMSLEERIKSLEFSLAIILDALHAKARGNNKK